MFTIRRTTASIALLLVCLPNFASFAHAASRYHSAKCLAFGTRCNEFLHLRSVHCKVGLAPEEQNSECYRFACMWCNLPGRADAYPCTAPFVRTLCNLDPAMTPSPSATPSEAAEPTMEPEATSTPEPTEMAGPMRKAPGACTWMGNPADDSAVISLDRVVPAAGWTPKERDGFSGLVYERTKNHGIDKAGEKGVMCFPVKLTAAGDYLLTAVSYAPHHTEYNDQWIAVNKTLKFVDTNSNNVFYAPRPMKYVKAYQNKSFRGISNDMYTKDHDGHRFIVVGVKDGETIQVCMSGRSYRYEVFRLVLKKCSGRTCTGGGLWNADKLPVSKCI